MAGEDDDSKQHEPTQKKLDDARKRGEVARSSDLNTAMSYLVLLLLASAVGASTMTGLGGRVCSDAGTLGPACAKRVSRQRGACSSARRHVDCMAPNPVVADADGGRAGFDGGDAQFRGLTRKADTQAEPDFSAVQRQKQVRPIRAV